MKSFLLLLLSLLFVFSACKESRTGNGNLSEEQLVKKQQASSINNDTVKKKLSNNMDSVTIQYWNNINANTYKFTISSNGNIRVEGNPSFLDTKKISLSNSANQFIDYVNQFYIDKTQEIILDRKEKPTIVTNYPRIDVEGYRKGEEVFNESTKIGEESYEIQFNSKFVEFYKFLEKITSQR